MTDKTETKKQTQSATIQLIDNTLTSFEAVKSHMLEAMPGIMPNNADVVRVALHIAASSVANKCHRTLEGKD